MPKNEAKRFEVLHQEAVRALRAVPRAVPEAIWYELDQREMPWPDGFEDRQRLNEAQEAFDDGLLVETGSEMLAPNEELDAVASAFEAVDKLQRTHGPRIEDSSLRSVTSGAVKGDRHTRVPEGPTISTPFGSGAGIQSFRARHLRAPGPTVAKSPGAIRAPVHQVARAGPRSGGRQTAGREVLANQLVHRSSERRMKRRCMGRPKRANRVGSKDWLRERAARRRGSEIRRRPYRATSSSRSSSRPSPDVPPECPPPDLERAARLNYYDMAGVTHPDPRGKRMSPASDMGPP